MFRSAGLLSQIAAKLSGGDSPVPQRKPAVWGEGTGLMEHDAREIDTRTPGTSHYEDRAEEAPLWFGWWQ